MSFSVLAALPVYLKNQSLLRACWGALLAGLVASLAFAPFGAWPVFFIAFPILYFLVAGARRARDAFLIGWCFAFGHLCINLHWMAAALFVDLASFWWALPFAIGGLPAMLSLYYATAAAASWRWRMGPLALAALWALADLARAHLFTGLPWDIAGYIWADTLPMMQSVSLIGVEGLGALTLAAAFAPALWLETRARFYAVGPLLLLLTLALWGQGRVIQAQEAFVPDVRLRLVQSDQDQAMKWKPEQRQFNLSRLLAATFDGPGEKKVTHYLWPETATSYYLAEEPLIRSQIAAHLPIGSHLLTGVVRRSFNTDGTMTYYNSLIALDAHGNVMAGYDKHHLVPFGEYMPLRHILPLRMISAFGGDFSAGPGALTIRVPGVPPLSPLICYEAIFSGDVAERADPPRWLLNVTNDGWYDGTIGPAQHFAISRLRAVEEGVPLVRIANKGITAVIDPWGRITAQPMDAKAKFFDADLPQPLTTPTVLQKQQVRPVWLIMLIWLALLGCKKKVVLTKKKGKKER